MKKISKMFLLLLMMVVLPGQAEAAVYEGGPTVFPLYIASEKPFMVEFSINGLNSDAEYYIKARLEDSSGKYFGQTYDRSSAKWLKQTDAWTLFPKLTGRDAIKGSSMVLKFPLAQPGAYQLQIVIRKASSATTELVQGKGQIEVLDISENGNGGLVSGQVSSGLLENLKVKAVGLNTVLSYYLTENNGVPDGSDCEPGSFTLPVPSGQDFKLLVDDEEGNIIAYSETRQIQSGEHVQIGLSSIKPFEATITSPTQSSFHSFNFGPVNLAVDIKNGAPPYIFSGNIFHEQTGSEVTRITKTMTDQGIAEESLYGLPDGSYAFAFTAQDSLGQDITKHVTFTIDSTPPVGQAYVPEFTNRNSIVTHLEHYDETSGVKEIGLGLDDVPDWQEAAEYANLRLPETDGEYPVFYKVRDHAGNIASYTYTITLDRIAPEKPIAKGNLKFINKSTSRAFLVKIQCEPRSFNEVVFEDEKGMTVKKTWASDLEGIITKKIDLRELSDGPIVYLIRSRDNAGNKSQLSEYKVQKDTLTPALNILSLVDKPTGKMLIMRFQIIDRSRSSTVLISTLRSDGRLKSYRYTVKNNITVKKKIKRGKKQVSLTMSVTDPAGNRRLRKMKIKN